MSAMDHLLSTLEAAVSTGSALSRIDNHEGLQGSTKCSCKNLHFSFAITYIFCLQLSTFLFYNKHIRWTDRLQSSSGEWSGNLCDFYFRVYNKIQKDIKVPFDMKGGDRIDDTPVHKAVREALANCLVNTDFFGKYGVIIKKEPDCLVLENPGYIRVGKKQMIHGGKSDPRNKALMKMFNMINIGERAGSGVPNIFQTWDHENWIDPVIDESFGPDRTVLTLSFIDKTTQAPPKHHPIKYK